MAIRINRIKVNRGGPLNSDFEIEPSDLNLIYGKNETGKTYVVESMINLLFRTGRKSPIKWNLRNWDVAGRISVAGLEDEPIIFTKTGKKIEDYWEEGLSLPKDLSRLLVVKAGDTMLTEELDGVGRNILKDYLCVIGDLVLNHFEHLFRCAANVLNIRTDDPTSISHEIWYDQYVLLETLVFDLWGHGNVAPFNDELEL